MSAAERDDRRQVIITAVMGGLLLIAAAIVATDWVDWSAIGQRLRPHVGVVMLAGVGVGLLGASVVTQVRRRRGGSRPVSPALNLWVVMAAAAVVAVTGWGATSWLLSEANQALDAPAARVEAIKTGLSIGAGTAGVFALLLAVRRQWHQEHSTAATELDAAAKRVTELYAKAADQLGSDKAPVRLAGLYALERVAQNNPDQRQTIVNVLCAYLRMPYKPPGDTPTDDADEAVHAVYQQRVQEREVRLTAQRLLSDHLRPGNDPKNPAATFWRDPEIQPHGPRPHRHRSHQLQTD